LKERNDRNALKNENYKIDQNSDPKAIMPIEDKVVLPIEKIQNEEKNSGTEIKDIIFEEENTLKTTLENPLNKEKGLGTKPKYDGFQELSDSPTKLIVGNTTDTLTTVKDKVIYEEPPQDSPSHKSQ
jgi:hypothetical protein